MSYYDAVQIYFGRENALQGYWTLYVVIIGGLLVFASLRKQPDILTTLLVTLLFGIFAYKNLGAIEGVTAQQVAVVEAVKPAAAADLKSAEFDRRLGPTLTVTPLNEVRWFHIAGDVLTIAALWAMELRRRRGQGEG